MNSGKLMFGAALCVVVCACAHAEPSPQRIEAADHTPASSSQAGTSDAGAESPSSHTPTNNKTQNSAARLIKHTTRIERVEVLHRDSGELVGTLDRAALDSFRKALAGSEVYADLTATSPRWPVRIRIHVAGRDVPYVGVPHGESRLRLDPRASALLNTPIHDDGGVARGAREVDIGERGMRAIEQSMGDRVPLNQEYRPEPGRLDLSDYRMD